MKVVHYMHKDKLWYYWVDESEHTKYYRKDLSKTELLSENKITEHQAKLVLKEKFPEHKIMKALPFHDSPSNISSRPIKTARDRKRQKKKKFLF